MITTKWFNGNENLNDSFNIRRKVFIEEQKIDESLEFNGSDDDAYILVVYENNKPIGTGRIIFQNDECLLGRIAVLKEERGKKIGDLIVRMLIRKSFEMGAEKQYVHAQIRAKAFYETLGFISYGDEYYEDTILHISMVHRGDILEFCIRTI